MGKFISIAYLSVYLFLGVTTVNSASTATRTLLDGDINTEHTLKTDASDFNKKKLQPSETKFDTAMHQTTISNTPIQFFTSASEENPKQLSLKKPAEKSTYGSEDISHDGVPEIVRKSETFIRPGYDKHSTAESSPTVAITDIYQPEDFVSVSTVPNLTIITDSLDSSENFTETETDTPRETFTDTIISNIVGKTIFATTNSIGDSTTHDLKGSVVVTTTDYLPGSLTVSVSSKLADNITKSGFTDSHVAIAAVVTNTTDRVNTAISNITDFPFATDATNKLEENLTATPGTTICHHCDATDGLPVSLTVAVNNNTKASAFDTVTDSTSTLSTHKNVEISSKTLLDGTGIVGNKTFANILNGNNSTSGHSFGDEMLATESFPYSKVLDADGRFIAYWKFVGDNVTFEVHVKTHGYVGFGMSRSGGMYPADVVIGGIKDGVPYFADYHTVANTEPVLDQSQDWTLIYAQDNSFGTLLKFTRKLKTCDENDRTIVLNNQNVNFIYAYHADDMEAADWLPYHGMHTRGRKEVSLQNLEKNKYSQDVKLFRIYNTKFHLPSSGTHYRCQLVRFPKLDRQHHFIAYENYIQPGNEYYVHHMGLYGCSQLDDSYDGYSFNCLEELIFMNFCRRFYTVSGVGSLPFVLPEHLGLPIGGPDDPTFLMLQTHYNNKVDAEGIVDSSGFHAYYTANLRQYPASVLITGELPRPWSEIIPPNYKDFMSIAHCGPECTTKAMAPGVDAIKAVAIAHHSHLMGRRIITRHIRDGVELKPIAEDKLFNFDYQGGAIILEEEVTIKKGDIIRVDCHYDSTAKSSFTYGGFGTGNEMCATFMLYYPKMAIEQCYSMPVYSDIDTDPLVAAAKIKSWNYTDPIVRDRFQKLVENSDYVASCMDGIQLPQKHRVPAPAISKSYPPIVPECPSI